MTLSLCHDKDESSNNKPIIFQTNEKHELIYAQKKSESRSKITTHYMTKYEKSRILGTRALQLSLNAPQMVDPEGKVDSLEIAVKELRAKKIPFIVRSAHKISTRWIIRRLV